MLGEISPPAECVEGAYRDFWEHNNYFEQEKVQTERGRDVEGVAKVLWDFCAGKGLKEPAYQAARLVPIAEGMEYWNCREALRNNVEGAENGERIFELLANQLEIKKFWGKQAEHEEMYGSEIRSHLRDGYGGHAVPEEVWRSEPSFVAPEKLWELAKTVNISSFPIAAAWALVNLRNHSAPDVATLKRAFMSETLLAPVCESIGLDGLAMTLNSAAIRARFEHGGDEEYLERAKEILERGGAAEQYEQKIRDSLGILTDDFFGEKVVNYDKTHRVLFGEGLCQVKGNGHVQVVWRRKSLGSIAKKLKKYDQRGCDKDSVPADIVGLTIVVPDDSDTGEILAEIVQRMQGDSGFELSPSPSRQCAISVRGEGNYVDEIAEGLARGEIDMSNVALSEDKRGMNGAKVTYVFGGVPMELQIITNTMRQEMRTGRFSHFEYKLSHGGSGLGAVFLKKLHSRKGGIGSGEIWSGSKESLREFKRRIGSAAANCVIIGGNE